MKEIDFPHRSRFLGREKRALLLLPEPFHPGRIAGVCYLLHGFGGNRRSWSDRTPLAELARDLGVVFVLPESGRRWFIDDHQGKYYQSYLLHELLPTAEAEISVAPGRLRRSVGGFSAGGAAAVFLALRHADLFGAAFAHSGAFYAARRVGDPYRGVRGRSHLVMPDEVDHDAVWGPPGSLTRTTYDPEEVVEAAAQRGGSSPLLHLDVGLDDHPRVLSTVREFRMQLVRRGIPNHYRELPGGHDWDYVGRALPGALDFLVRCLRTVDQET